MSGADTPHPLPDSLQQLFDRFYLEAICQKQAGHPDAEYDLLSQALRIHPDAPEALCEMGQLLLQHPAFSNDTSTKSGIRLIERAYSLDSTYQDYAVALAQACYMTGDFEKSARIYRRLLQEHYSEKYFGILLYIYYINNDTDSLFDLCDLQDRHEGGPTEESINRRFLFLTRSDDSTKVEQKAAEFFLRDTTSREALDAYTRFVYERQGDPRLPLHHTRQMLQSAPHDQALCQGLLNCYQLLPEHADEYRALLDSLMLSPGFATERKAAIAYASQASWLTHVSQEHIVALIRQALRQPQENSMLWRCYLNFLMQEETAPDTLYEAQQQILRLDPDDTDMRLECLRTALSELKLDTALAICQEGTEYAPSYLVFSYYGALALFTNDQPEQAIEMLSEGLARANENTPTDLWAESYAMLGDLYHDRGNDEQSFAAYEQCLAHNPSNYGCLNNYAYFLSLKGRDLDRAEEMSHRAVQGEPENATYLDTYAWILYQKKQYTQACIYIEQALHFMGDDNTSPAIYDHAGDIYYRAGQPSKALDCWNKALSLTDDTADAAKIKRKISRRRL